MCDLPEFDETSQIQKKYNLLSWYLVAAIIFYAIPAYQLVITYQQVCVIRVFTQGWIHAGYFHCWGIGGIMLVLN